MTVDEFDEALTDLETRVDRLRALYENWFRGYEKTEPSVPRKDVERRVYALRKELPRNTALRFRYHQLYLKYTTMANYWQRTARQIEEGTYRPQLQRLKRKHEREQEQEARRERRKHDRPEEDEAAGPRAFELDLDESLSVDDLLDELEIEEVAKALERPGPHTEPPPPAAKTPAKPAPAVASFGKSAATVNSPTAGRPVAQVGAVRTAAGEGAGTGSLPKAPPPFSGPGTGSLPKPPAFGAGPGTGTQGIPRPPPPTPTGVRAQPGSAGAAPAAAAPTPAGPAGAAPARPATAPGARPQATPGSPPAAARPAVAAPTPAAGAAPPARPAAPTAPRPAPAAATPRTAPAAPSGTTIGRPAPVTAPAAQRAPVQGSGTFVGRPPAASPLSEAAAPDEQRLKRIYEEYTAARRRNNEGEVRFEQLVGSIQKMLPELSKKHQGKRIDFEVVVKDGRVGLKPKAT